MFTKMENRIVKKIFLCVMIMLLSVTAIFSGCNLIQTDGQKLADSVCAEVGDIKVTRRELVNYYYSAYQQTGNAYDVNELLEELINQKLIIKQVKENLSSYVLAINETMENASGTTLADIANKYYHNKALQSAYDYIDSQILIYENNIRASKGMALIKEDNKSSNNTSSNSSVKYEKLYESKLERSEDGDIVVKFEPVDFEDSRLDKAVDGSDKLVRGYNYLKIDHGDQATRTLAFKRYIKSLIRSEEGKNLDQNEDNVLTREIDRLFKVYEEQQYLKFYEEKYLRQQLALDKMSGTDGINAKVVERYKQLVKESYSKFMLEGDNAYNEYIKAMNSDSNAVYYHPYASNADGKGFIQVAHVLIKFTDEQINDTKDDEVLSYKEIMEIENTEERENALEEWVEKCLGQAKYLSSEQEADETKIAGNAYGEKISYKDIFNEIKNALNEVSTLEDKAALMNDFMYKYSEDEGSLNLSHYYNVSLDTSIFNDDNKESWVKEFADAARLAYSTNGAGTLVAEPVFVNQLTEKDGKYTGYCGYHIIFVVKEYENLCDINSVDALNEDFAEILFNTRVMSGVEEKSLYDVIYDTLTLTNYSNYRKDQIKIMREDLNINYYKNAYKDLIQN